MPTINDYKKQTLNGLGFTGDINTAESKWLKSSVVLSGMCSADGGITLGST